MPASFDYTLLDFMRRLGFQGKEYLGYQWAHKGWLQVVSEGRRKMVPGDYAARVIADWDRSCSRKEAAQLTGTTPDWIRHAIENKKVETITVLVFERVLRSEFEKIRRLWEESQKDVEFPEEWGLARYSSRKRHELAQRAHLVHRKRTGQKSTRGPISQKERLASSRRLKRLHGAGRIPYMTTSRATKLGRLGGRASQEKARQTAVPDPTRELISLRTAARIIHSFDVTTLFAQGRVQGMIQDGELMIYRDSAERLANRRKKKHGISAQARRK
jgi:hypothetical protein